MVNSTAKPGERKKALWPRRAVWGLVAFYLLYLLAANVFLNTSLASMAINRKPEKFTLEWSHAVSWWPGWVKAWDVRMHGHVRKWEWTAAATEAHGRIAILPLFWRELRMPWITAESVTGGMKHHVVLIEPPMQGATITTSVQPPPAVPAAAGAQTVSVPAYPNPENAWTLRFDRIQSDSIVYAYFDGWMLEGNGKAEFGFVKKLRGGPLEILPSHFESAQSRLRRQQQEWLHDVKLAVDLRIDKHRHEEASGIDKLMKTVLEIRMEGAAPGLGIDLNVDGHLIYQPVALEHGRVRVDIGIDHGSLRPGSLLDWQIPLSGGTNNGDEPLRENVLLQLRADQNIQLRMQVPQHSEGHFYLDADLRVTSNQLPLRDWRSAIPHTSGYVIGRWRFGSLHWLGRMFPDAPWLVLSGSGEVDADVRIENGQLADGSHISVPEAKATVDVMGYRIQGMGRANIGLEMDQTQKLLSKLAMTMQQFAITAPEARGANIVEGNDLELDLQTTFSTQQTSSGSDSFQARLAFNDARVPDLRAYNHFLPNSQLRFDGGSGHLSGELNIGRNGEVGQGWLRAAAQRASLYMAGLELRSDVAIDANLRRAGLKTRSFSIDGSTIRLTNTRFSEPGGASQSGWWARIWLDRAKADWSQSLQVSGSGRLEARDASFLLSLYAGQKDYPEWISRLIGAEPLQASGRVSWQNDTFVLNGLQADNERFQLAARLRLREDQRTGSLYARFGILSTALEMNNEKRDFHWLHSREWYDAQPDL